MLQLVFSSNRNEKKIEMSRQQFFSFIFLETIFMAFTSCKLFLKIIFETPRNLLMALSFAFQTLTGALN